MYKHIESQLILAGMTKKELAKITGIGYNTLLTKMHGKSEFTFKEACKIKRAIQTNEPIEVLFEDQFKPPIHADIS